MCSVEMRIFSACLSVRKGELTVGRDPACLAKPRRQGVASGTNCSGGRGSLWGLCPCTYSDRTVLEGLLSSGDGEDTDAAILAANVTLSSVGLCVRSPCHHHPPPPPRYTGLYSPRWQGPKPQHRDPQRITCLCRQTSWAPRPVRWPQRHPRCVCELQPPSARPACPR